MPADLSEEEMRMAQEKVGESIQQEGGLIIEIKPAARRSVSFLDKNRREAFLTSANFQMAQDKLLTLELKLKQEPRILRYLLSIKPKINRASFSRRRPVGLKTAPISEETVKSQPKIELAEIDKKLEEILGKGDEG